MNGDGLADIVQLGPNRRLQVYLRLGDRPHLLRAIREQAISGAPTRGRRFEITYSDLSDPATYTPALAGQVQTDDGSIVDNCRYPQRCIRGDHMPVVSRHGESDGVGGIVLASYRYEDARSDVRGRGWLGFGRRTVSDPRHHTVSTVTYGARTASSPLRAVTTSADGLSGTYFYPFAQRPTSTESTLTLSDGEAIVDRETLAFVVHPTNGGATHFMETRTATHTHIDQPRNGPRVESVATETRVMDDHGNVTSRVVHTPSNDTLTETMTYDEVPSDWLIGRLSDLTTTSRAASGETQTRTTHDDWFLGTTLLQRSTVRAANAASVCADMYRESAFGLVTESIARTPCDLSVPNGDVVEIRRATTEYDAEGVFPRQETSVLRTPTPQLQTTSATFHRGLGVPLTVTDLNGNVTRFAYDTFGRRRSVTAPDGTTTTIDVLAAPGTSDTAMVDVTTASTGHPSATERLDVLGRTVAQFVQGFDGQLVSTEHVFDGAGNLSSVSRPHPAGSPATDFSRWLYDFGGRPIFERQPAGGVVLHTYRTRASGNGYETVVTDPNGHVRASATDLAGRTVERVEGATSVSPVIAGITRTTYDYGAFDRLRAVHGANNASTSVSYDAFGRPLTLDDSDTGHHRYVHNGFGQLLRAYDDLDAKPSVALTYDDLGRVVVRADRDGLTTIDWDTAQFGVGRVARTTSAVWATSSGGIAPVVHEYRYDIFSRLAADTMQADGGAYSYAYRYDSLGRLAQMDYPSITTTLFGGRLNGSSRRHFAVRYGYNATGFLETAVDVSGVSGNAPGRELWRARETATDGQLTFETFGNGLTSHRIFDGAGRMTDVQTFQPLPGSYDVAWTRQGPGGALRPFRQRLRQIYDLGGNVASRTDSLQANGAGLTEQFSYDPLDRLRDVTGPQSQSYTYDDAGNLRSGAGDVYTQESSRPHVLDRFTPRGGPEETLHHDVLGRLVSRTVNGAERRHVDYTAFDLPREVTDASGVTRFAYDSDGTRVLRAGPSSATLYAGAFTREIARGGSGQYDGAVSNRMQVSAGGRVVAEVEWQQNSPTAPVNQERTHYVHDDHLGTSTVVTDEHGNTEQRVSFDAFGRRRDPDWRVTSVPGDALLTREGFTGHESDEALGLVNMRGRMYDPQTRRFLSADPFAAIGSSQGLNRYAYVVGNPLTHTDSSGFGCDPSLANPCNDSLAQWGTGDPIGSLLDLALGDQSAPLPSAARAPQPAGSSGATRTQGYQPRQAAGAVAQQSGRTEISPARWYSFDTGSPLFAIADRGSLLLAQAASDVVPAGGVLALSPLVRRNPWFMAGYLSWTASTALTQAVLGTDWYGNEVSASGRLMNLATGLGSLLGMPDLVNSSVLGLNSFASASRTASVSSGLGDRLPASLVRVISRGERVADLIDEVAGATYQDGLERAIISTMDGDRLIVQGGAGGMSFEGFDVRRVLLHTHPITTGPSSDDFNMLRTLGQRSSWIYELFGGGLSRFRRY